MPNPISSLSRALAHLRWLYMPLGLFALIAVGVHAGATAAHDALLVSLDWLDGLGDRAAASALTAAGGIVGADPASVERWIVRAVGLVDLRERELLARWLAVILELAADLFLALPALGYRERQAEEVARDAERQARLAELVQQKLERLHPGARPAPRGDDLKVLLRSAVLDPTLLRVFLPLATGCAAVAGAARVAIEMQSISYGLLAPALEAKLAGDLGRAIALFVLGAVLVCLGLRSVLQALWWAHRASERDRTNGRIPLRARLRGWMRLSVAGPLATAAVLGVPLLSFFR